MKRKRLSIIRILFYMIILTVIGAVLFLGGRTYRSVKRVESYQIVGGNDSRSKETRMRFMDSCPSI